MVRCTHKYGRSYRREGVTKKTAAKERKTMYRRKASSSEATEKTTKITRLKKRKGRKKPLARVGAQGAGTTYKPGNTPRKGRKEMRGETSRRAKPQKKAASAKKMYPKAHEESYGTWKPT